MVGSTGRPRSTYVVMTTDGAVDQDLSGGVRNSDPFAWELLYRRSSPTPPPLTPHPAPVAAATRNLPDAGFAPAGTGLRHSFRHDGEFRHGGAGGTAGESDPSGSSRPSDDQG